MEETDVQRAHREKLGLRVGPEMAKYVLRHLETSNAIPIIAADARTGVATLTRVNSSEVRTILKK